MTGATCYFDQLELANGQRFRNVQSGYAHGPSGVVSPNGKRTVPCQRLISARNNVLIWGKLRILVRYRAWAVYEMEVAHPFVSVGSHGRSTR